MAPRNLLLRPRRFSLDVLSFCRRLPRTDEAREIAGQVRRAANSLRSNYRTARNGRSRAGFISKLGEAYEEADECRNWPEHPRDARVAHRPGLIEEARQITQILNALLKTARGSAGPKPAEHRRPRQRGSPRDT